MNGLNPYWLIIFASVIVVISYFFNLVSKRTNFPSVLLLLLLGMLIKTGFSIVRVPFYGLDPVLEILGIVGLIMIVLEASLDLQFSREKRPIILKALLVAFLSLAGGSISITLLLQLVMETDFLTSMIHSIPLSIVSSAIIIPSVLNFKAEQREFMIYEATFSDILGILFFYFTTESTHIENPGRLFLSIFTNIVLTLGASVVLSFLIILVFQRIKTQVKLFLLLAVLITLYSIGKLFHTSSLLLILAFGLMLENKEMVFQRYSGNYVSMDAIGHIHANFKLITLETSFIIRTFFFVIFGMSIPMDSILNIGVITTSLIITGILLLLRYLFLKLILRRGFQDILFLVPRGLITILLFYSIPPGYKSPAFNPGILFFIILFTSIIMTLSLLHQKWQRRLVDIRREHVYEAYGRFISDKWVPPTRNGDRK